MLAKSCRSARYPAPRWTAAEPASTPPWRLVPTVAPAARESQRPTRHDQDPEHRTAHDRRQPAQRRRNHGEYHCQEQARGDGREPATGFDPGRPECDRGRPARLSPAHRPGDETNSSAWLYTSSTQNTSCPARSSRCAGNSGPVTSLAMHPQLLVRDLLQPVQQFVEILFASVEAAGLLQHSIVRRFDTRADAVVADRLGLDASAPLVYRPVRAGRRVRRRRRLPPRPTRRDSPQPHPATAVGVVNSTGPTFSA